MREGRGGGPGRLGEDLGRVLPRAGHGALVGRGVGGEADGRAGVARLAAGNGVGAPVVAGVELGVLEHLRHGRDGEDEEAPALRLGHELGLRLRPEEVADDPDDAVELLVGLLTSLEESGVGNPVLVAGGLVAAALLADPLHEAAGEGSNGVPEEVGERDEPVFRFPDQLEGDGPDDGAARDTNGLGGAGGGVHGLAEGSERHRLLDRDVDVLAAPRMDTIRERDEGGAGGLGGAVQVGLWGRHADGRGVG